MRQAPFIFGFAGWSGSGKTTLAEKLIARVRAADIAISSIKHAHHNFDADKEGKDSWRHRKAGAGQVLVASDQRMALFTEKTETYPPELDDLLARLAPCDWVLVEGFKKSAFAKIEVYDGALSQPSLYVSDRNIIALASNVPHPNCDLPQFDRDDIEGIFAFLCAADKQVNADRANADQEQAS